MINETNKVKVCPDCKNNVIDSKGKGSDFCLFCGWVGKIDNTKTAQDLITESEGLTSQDTEEQQIRASVNITKCLKEMKGGLK